MGAPRRGRPLADTLLFAACWLLAELAGRPLFTGFPWIASGYAHAVGPLAAWAPWIGVLRHFGAGGGLGAALAWLPRSMRLRARVALAAGVLGVLAAPLWLPRGFTQPAGRLDVSLVQPAVAQDLKFDPLRMDANLRALVQQIEAAQGTLVVAPESVIPFTRAEIDPLAWAHLVRRSPHRAGAAC